MNISENGLAMIKVFEGCKLEAYPDPASGGDPWTIGVGHTKGVFPGMRIDDAQADAFLREDLADAEAAVARLVKVPLTQGQYDALASFTFNLGAGNLANSTLLRLLNAGHYGLAAGEFPKWNRGPNGPMLGLTDRRLAEQKLFQAAD